MWTPQEWDKWRVEIDDDLADSWAVHNRHGYQLSSVDRRVRRSNRAGMGVIGVIVAGVAFVGLTENEGSETTEVAASPNPAITAKPPIILTPTTTAYVAEWNAQNRPIADAAPRTKSTTSTTSAPPTTTAPPTTIVKPKPTTTLAPTTTSTTAAPTTTTTPPTTIAPTTTVPVPAVNPNRISIEAIDFDSEWRQEDGPDFYSPPIYAGLHSGYEAPGGDWAVIGIPRLMERVEVGHKVVIGERSWDVYRVGEIDRLGQLELHTQTGEQSETVVLWEAVVKHERAEDDVRRVVWLR